MTAPSTDPRGLKRLCTECGIRFYDMNKRPIICPNCGAEYAGFDKTKSRPTVVDEKPTNENTKSTEEEEIDGDDDPLAGSDAAEINLDDAAAMEDNDNADDDEAMDLGDGDMDELDSIDVDGLDDDAALDEAEEDEEEA